MHALPHDALAIKCSCPIVAHLLLFIGYSNESDFHTPVHTSYTFREILTSAIILCDSSRKKLNTIPFLSSLIEWTISQKYGEVAKNQCT